MTNNKQSSVEWLYDELFNSFQKYITLQYTLEEYIANNIKLMLQAKAMHQEEVEDAWDKGDYCIDLPDGTWEQKYKSAEQYYNETFGE
jgi:vacuolar-type H+-ATPase subunit C/Vma6